MKKDFVIKNSGVLTLVLKTAINANLIIARIIIYKSS